jgi:PEP-CTERM motif
VKPPLGRRLVPLPLPSTRNTIVTLVVTLVVAFSLRVRADVYTTGVALSFAGAAGNVSAWTQPNLGGDGAIVSLTIDDNFELTPIAYSVGIGHVWYSVMPGTIIDPSFTTTAPPFVNAFTGYLGGRIQLVVGQSFLLGFWLDANGNGMPGSGDRFGWASFTYNPSGIILISSAIESTGTGIIAGTTTAVPEPNSLAFLAFGGAGLLTWRKCRARVPERDLSTSVPSSTF